MLTELKHFFDKIREYSDLEAIITKILCSGYYTLANDPRNKLGFLDDKNMSKDEQVDKLLSFLEEKNSGEEVLDQEKSFEEYIQEWKKNRERIFGPQNWINNEIQKMRGDHHRQLEENKTGSDKLFESLKEKFKHLKSNLLHVNDLVNLAPFKGVAFAFSQFENYTPVNWHPSRRNKRFLERSWFNDTETFLFNYFVGGESEEKLQEFLLEEELEKDFHHFQHCVNPWAAEIIKKIGNFNFRSLSKASVAAEMKRMEKFAYALILNDPQYLKEHKELTIDVLNTTTDLTSNESEAIFPSISFGQLPLQDGDKRRVVRLRFVLDQSCSHQAMKHLLETKFKNTVKSNAEVINDLNVVVLDVEVEGSDSEFMAKHIAVLSDLSIRGILIGSFGLGIGNGPAGTSDSEFRHCMNPTYNRIYSKNAIEKAEGFISTWFSGGLDRGGEPYYCPVGCPYNLRIHTIKRYIDCFLLCLFF